MTAADVPERPGLCLIWKCNKPVDPRNTLYCTAHYPENATCQAKGCNRVIVGQSPTSRLWWCEKHMKEEAS